MSKWMVYLLVFIIGFIGISVWSFWLVIHPSKITRNISPADFSLPYEDVIIEASDGTALSGWLIMSKEETQNMIIMLHGYPADRTDMLEIAEALYPDFSLLLLDLRYFGESEGAYTTLGIKERDDIRAVVNFVERSGYERIGIFGFSFGGALGLMSAAEDDRINAVGSYAAYSDLRQLGREAYSNLSILKYPLVELMVAYSRLLFGTSVTDLSPERSAQELTIPVFIIHTEEDDQIAFSHAKRLESALENSPQAEFYFPKRGRHGELPLDFYDRLKDFFSRSL